MGRRELREHIFVLLFFKEFHNEEELPEQIAMYLEGLGEVEGSDQSYMEEKYQHILSILTEIDEAVDKVAKGWKTDRMGKVDLTIIRLAVYEMRHDDEIPVGVAINEAVELAKKFGGDDSPAFINGILAKLV